MVLEYLAFRNLTNCMRVSRGWKDYIAKLPRLWLHLDLSGARKSVHRSFINKAVRYSESRLTKATIHRFEHVDVLKNVAKACKSLAELEFISLPHTMSATLIEIVQCAPSLKKFTVRPEITMDTVTQLLQHRPDLEHVCFNEVKQSYPDWRGPFPSLTSFSMAIADPTSSRIFQMDDFLAQMANLQSLTLTNLSFAATVDFSSLPLTSLVLKGVHIGNNSPPHLPATLQRLAITEYTGMMELNQSRTLLASHLPALTHLSLSGVANLSADCLEEFLDLYVEGEDISQIKHMGNATTLQSLTLGGYLREDRNGLFKNESSLFTRSPRILTSALHTLDISSMKCDDDEIEHLLMHETGLVYINLSSTNISGASIKMLVDKLPTLRTIVANNCSRISGRDAIEYAKTKGVGVQCSIYEGKGGKKVRYG